tara:strand:- start:314 stop:1324 length:1011 start_codon:yes stop_codon:yes gene_type:complete
MNIAPLALTLGEPAGIGPEVSLKAWPQCRKSLLPFFAIGPVKHYQSIARRLKIDTPVYGISSPNEAETVFSDGFPVLDIEENVSGDLGKVDMSNSELIVYTIKKAVRLIKSGQASGMVTSPIHKDVLYKTGFKFPGHTEFIANLDECSLPVMMLTSPALSVVPITIHISYKRVLEVLTTAEIVKKVSIVDEKLSTLFGIQKPCFAIAGLNPHAGEGGHFGNEEIDIIAPAIEKLQKLGMNVFGPVSPDALFLPDIRKIYDVAICMYHDQALIPVKTLDPYNTVNVTLGLSFVRSSPDHGTALNIAKNGTARADSMVSAIKLASRLVSHYRNTSSEK